MCTSALERKDTNTDNTVIDYGYSHITKAILVILMTSELYPTENRKPEIICRTFTAPPQLSPRAHRKSKKAEIVDLYMSPALYCTVQVSPTEIVLVLL